MRSRPGLLVLVFLVLASLLLVCARLLPVGTPSSSWTGAEDAIAPAPSDE